MSSTSSALGLVVENRHYISIVLGVAGSLVFDVYSRTKIPILPLSKFSHLKHISKAYWHELPLSSNSCAISLLVRVGINDSYVLR